MRCEENTRNIVIVLASGSGVRFRSETPKQFFKLAGKTVLEHTLDIFEKHPRVDEIIITVAPDQLLFVKEIVTVRGYRKVRKIVFGGATRRESSASAVTAIVGDHHKVIVHDAVRPLLDHATVDRCLDALDEYAAVDTGIPSPDTVVRVKSDGTILEIPDRSQMLLGQTPQGFRSGLLRKAHQLASDDSDLKVTDDCALILRYGLGQVKIVSGNINNIKITHPSDIYLADRIFQVRSCDIPKIDIEKHLRDKVCIVFGGSRGIGERIVDLAESYGAAVKSISRRDGVDVSDSSAVRCVLSDTYKKHGRLDAVVNTAGVLRTGALSGQSYSDIEEQIATNLYGSIVVAKEAFQFLKEGGGSIALFTSSSYTRGRANFVAYSSTKAAIVNLVQGLAQEFHPFGVRINAINPERTATPMRREAFGLEPDNELLNPDRVARATLSVLLTKANGEVIDVRR